MFPPIFGFPNGGIEGGGSTETGFSRILSVLVIGEQVYCSHPMVNAALAIPAKKKRLAAKTRRRLYWAVFEK